MFLGELENAQSTVQRCLELDPTSVHAHLLKSQIYLAQGNFAMCSHCLELGVSHNFQVGLLCALSPAPHLQAQLAAGPTGLGRGAPGAPCILCPSAGPQAGEGLVGSGCHEQQR